MLSPQMRRFISGRSLHRFSIASTLISSHNDQHAQRRYFFGKGWDNAAMETVYRAILRREGIRQELAQWLAKSVDSRTLEVIRLKGEVARQKHVPMSVFLPPHLGDPHRVLKAYALTSYPILDESGQQSTTQVDDQEYPLFADPDDEYSKVVLPNLDLVKMLAEELLKTLGWEVSPRGAASLMESMFRGAEIPDAVFETPKVLDSIEVMTKQLGLEAKHNK